MPRCGRKKKVARDYLEKLNNRTRGLESYQCRLEYLFEQPVFETKTLQKGVLYYIKDGGSSDTKTAKSLLRINFATRKEEEEKEQKYQDEYIFDGVWLTHIDYQVKEVKRYQSAESGKEGEAVDVFDLAAKNFPIIGFSKAEELEKNYDINQPVEKSEGGEKYAVLNLSPKADSEYKDYKTIELWIDDKLNLPAKIIATNADGDIYRVRFLEPKVNQKIDKKIFEYKIPKGFGVEIVPLKDK
jgi:outer membrane lipoprotein-sorting protein